MVYTSALSPQNGRSKIRIGLKKARKVQRSFPTKTRTGPGLSLEKTFPPFVKEVTKERDD